MNETPLLEQIIRLVSLNTNVEASKITSDTDFESLGFDSLSVLEMVATIRREFGVEVGEDRLSMCDTVGEMATTVADVVRDD